ncbi:oligosaccharide flippase family protein [Candidatus Nomurabacteria bacterium]|nr:oligosaccharide flippase family protein [Candidatus Nomurabacteria bacterium]
MVKRVLNFVYREVRGLHQAAYIIALFSVGSQILAIVRDRLLAHTFGAGFELDLYYAAFRIPDLLFVLFASVLSIYVLLPFVNKYSQTVDKKAGAEVLTQIFTLFLYVYVLVAGALALTAEWYVPHMFPGFAGEYESLVALLQILLLQPFLLGLSSLCGVVTQMNHRFILYALSPLLYNVGIILGIVLLYPLFGIVGLAIGVVVGAVGHLLIQIPFVVRSDYAFGLSSRIKWGLISKILSVSIPRAFTLSVNQIVLLVLIGIASSMSEGSVSVFQFAFNLQSVPLAIIGMSYSVAAFPTLSHLYAKSDHDGFNRQLLTALRHIIFWAVPVIGLVVVLRAQIVRVLLGSGQFDWSDTRLTAAVLAIFVLSLFAQAILLLLIRAFYAGGRTKLPLFVAIFGGSISIASAFILQKIYLSNVDFQLFLNDLFRLSEVEGAEILVLALAFIVGQLIQLVLLLAFSRRAFMVSYRSLIRLTIQACLASVAGGISAYVTLVFVVDGVNQDTFIGIMLQGVSAGVMGVIAVILTYLAMRSSEINEIYRSFHTKIFKTDVIAPQDN